MSTTRERIESQKHHLPSLHSQLNLLTRSRRQHDVAPVPYHKLPVFSFAAAGWLKVFYYGVGKCFQKHLDLSKFRFGGASAGALVAAGLVLDVDFDSVADYTFQVTNECRASLSGPFRLREYLYECLDKHIGPDAHIKATDRLFIAVTELPSMRPHTISKFRSRDELIYYLLASCLIPVLAGLPLPFSPDQGPSSLTHVPQGFTVRWLIDGGLRQMLPLFPDVDNFTCSAIGPAHLTPYRRLPTRYCVYPPEEEEFRRIYRQGYDDAAKWLLSVSIPSIGGDRPLLTLTHSRTHPHEIDNPLDFDGDSSSTTSSTTSSTSSCSVTTSTTTTSDASRFLLPSAATTAGRTLPPSPNKNKGKKATRSAVRSGSQLDFRPRSRHVAKYVPVSTTVDRTIVGPPTDWVRPEKNHLFYLQQVALTVIDVLLLCYSAVFLAPFVWYSHLVESVVTFVKRVLNIILLSVLRFIGLGSVPNLSLSESWLQFRNSLRLVSSTETPSTWRALLRFLPVYSYVIARRAGREELSSSSVYRLVKHKTFFPI